MPEKVNYNPDILSCLANLSSDEVFTPPEIANAMLDMLPQELFRSPDTRFLDPGCKSGVFLREIAKRLNEGLKDRIPDVEQRMDHIMKNQLFAIAITQITGLLSRRSVYCSKDASGRFSVARFDNSDGNIRYKRIEHKWDGIGKKENQKCLLCGASRKEYERSYEMENHAYEFIHMDKKTEKELIDMKFDVIIANPPYQISDGGGLGGSSAKPIYNQFVSQAKKLKPRYLAMIVPSRWFGGGKGLDEFRDEMINDDTIRIIHDFMNANECFPGVEIKGGVCYFLRERDNPGPCRVVTHKDGSIISDAVRPMKETGSDVFIRFNEAVSIYRKVSGKKEQPISDLISPRQPFGFSNAPEKRPGKNDVLLYERGGTTHCSMDDITRNRNLVDAPKVLISKAYNAGDAFPHQVVNKPFVAEPHSACTETYLTIGPFSSNKECENVISYIATRFFRLLVLLRKSSQNAAKGVYDFVPMQDFSKPWTDEELYKKYGLTDDEIAFIESMIKPMDLGGADA